MQIDPAQHASRQQLQDEVLALIRSRSAAVGEAIRKVPVQIIGLGKPADAATAAAPAQVEAAVQEINQALKVLSTSLHFEFDQASGRTIVKVVDRDSGELLRQLPSEATLQIARSLDRLVGQLVDQTA